jgi:SAM-dependent methyltransferase
MRAVTTEQQVQSWASPDYAVQWAGEDLLADMLALPRQISAALVADAGVAVSSVIDLGAGPGGYLEVLLSAFPDSRATWTDSSEAMESQARERLAAFGDRVSYRLGDLEELDSLDLEPADVVVSSRVIHHFSPESIQRLYREIHELVRPGGFFFNLDHYGSPEGWEQRYRRIREQFIGRRKQELKPHRHDFPFSVITDHLNWLEQAGFEAPDVPWRTFYTALLAARSADRGR